jgi:glycosyltransferase involved in cell wall biosynthesis
MDGVRVVYVSREGALVTRNIRFLRYAFEELSNKPVVVLIKYFPVISLLLRICKPSQCFILDIRTGSVDRQPIKRIIFNSQLKFEAKYFKNITVISSSLSEKLNISCKAHILPIGSDIISSTNKTFKELRLIYVGTLHGRNIEKTIGGFKTFYDEYNSFIPISYTIIGDGPNNEVENLRELVAKNYLTGVVTLAGRVQHDQLKEYFNSTNIGVSYIPLTPYYDVQPPAKTFEYLLSGMPVIATQTSENKKLINPGNGILIGESAEEFYLGLKKIYESRDSFDSKLIRDSNINHTWEKIVLDNLEVYLKDLISEETLS